MMILCRRDSSGFLNELYYRCLACGYVPEKEGYTPKAKTVHKQPRALPKLRTGHWRWEAATVAILASLAMVSVMQIPVPTTVFAAETSMDPVKDILPYINLVNFTMSQFSFNYTEGQMTLRVSADSASLTSTETAENVTTCIIILGKVLVNYQDANRIFNMGFASLTLTVTIRFEELIAQIDGTAYLPLWTAIINRLTGQIP
jgi:hypothetical protein